jgi:hypothetical protein
MLFSPSDRMTDHVSGFFHVEIPGPEEAQKVGIIWHLSFMSLGQAVSKLDKARFLGDGKLPEEPFDVLRVQFRG